MTKETKLKIYVLSLVAVAFIILAINGREKLFNRRHNSIVTEGKITEKGDRAKTDSYVAYTFSVDGKQYYGSVPIQFCNECKENCCQIGAKVKVRYEKGNPENNDLIH